MLPMCLLRLSREFNDAVLFCGLCTRANPESSFNQSQHRQDSSGYRQALCLAQKECKTSQCQVDNGQIPSQPRRGIAVADSDEIQQTDKDDEQSGSEKPHDLHRELMFDRGNIDQPEQHDDPGDDEVGCSHIETPAARNRAHSSSAVIPLMRTTLFRLVWPAAMLNELFGSFNNFARRSMQAALALPSTGGAVTATFSAPSLSPMIPGRLACGRTRS